MAKTILILGGSYAGLHIAHYLLKQNLPDVKVVLVTANSHFYWNMASVRAVVPEASLPDTQLFSPISQILSRYPRESYELVIGTATASEFTSKTVTVDKDRQIPYDHLVIATGSRQLGTDDQHATPWKADGSYEDVLVSLRATAEKVGKAGHVVVAGAGPTGCELAGEIAFDNPSRQTRKEVVLLGADPEILHGDSIAASTAAELKKLGVQTRTGARVKSVKEVAGGKTEVVLEDGETIVTDLYLPTMGVRPNSDFVDGRYKDDKGWVVVDDTLKVEGAEGVWAAGDVVNKPRCGFLITQKQVSYPLLDQSD
jgi:NADH dehydrogenase FAD-containing subunit